MRKSEILKRLRAIREELRSADAATVTTLTAEAEQLKAELQQIEARDNLFEGLNLDDNGEGSDGDDLHPVQRRGVAPAGQTGAPRNESPEERRARVIASPEYRTAFMNRLRGIPLSESEQRAMSTAAGSAGPAIPTTTANMIIERLEQVTALYPHVTRSNVPGTFKVPVETAAQAAAWHTENATVNSSEPSLTDVTFGGFELIKLVTISKAARLMTIDKFEDYIVNQIVRKMSLAIEAAIISGSGNGEPTGIMTGVTFTKGTNKVEYTKNGVPTYDDIMDTLGLLKSPYHANAVWVCSTKTKYGKLKKIKDNEGRPMFVDDRIDGKVVIPDDSMPDGALLLCDPAYYQFNIQDDISVDVSDQAGFRSAQVDYRGYAVADGKPLLAEAFVLLSMSAT